MDTFFHARDPARFHPLGAIRGGWRLWCANWEGRRDEDGRFSWTFDTISLGSRSFFFFFFIGETFHSQWNFGNGTILYRKTRVVSFSTPFCPWKVRKTFLPTSRYTREMVCQPSMQHCITLEIRKFCVFVSSDTFLSLASSIYLLLSSSSNFETRNYPGVIVENRLPLSLSLSSKIRSDLARKSEF